MRTTFQLINSGWQVRDIPRPDASPTTRLPWLPATVPGHVHLDLVRAGVIPDPFKRLYERDVAWVDETDWIYETTFHADSPAPEHAYLIFYGLDTVAEITLNGEPLGRADNMFIPHEFPVGGRLRAGDGEAGDNVLRVTFSSALRIGRERHRQWDDTGNPTTRPDWFFWGPRSFVRKAQYMYGWDWGPELISCGLWRPVELLRVPTARLLDWKHDVQFTDDGKAVVTIEASVERAPGAQDAPLTFTASFTEVGNETEDFLDALPAPVSAPVPTGEGPVSVSLSVTVDAPRRWWPNLLSEPGQITHPTLYTLEMSLDSGETRVHEKQARIGLRTIELVREPDADGQGEGFKFRVNGQDIFMKGANWIPVDSFPARPHPEARFLEAPLPALRARTQELVWMACDAGFNMLRVWGGGLYESEHFYDQCDAHGILVWQDFPYGCAYYPDTGEYAEAARAEATAAVRRIRNHPSLALWCGNNENSTMYHDGWGGSRPPRLLGGPLYDEVLPGIVAAEDPRTPYWTSSPYGGENPNSPDYGDRHNWDVWHGVGDWTHYLQDRSRFCSEFGFASSCGLPAWDKCLSDQDKYPQSPAVRWHDKTRKGYETYLGLIALHFPEAQTLEDLVYYSQLNQAEALKCGVEHYRRLKGRCWGTLIWQINDCWPVQSWAMIDSEAEPKAAFYAAKKFYAPVLLSLVRRGDQVEAHLTNDLPIPVTGRVSLVLESFDGEALAQEVRDASAAANGTAAVATLDLAAAQGRDREACVYARFEPGTDSQAAPSENFLLLAEPKDLRIADPGLDVRVEEGIAEHLTVTLTAKRFAPYVWLRRRDNQLLSEPTSLSGIVDNFFHVRAGESKTLNLPKGPGMETPEDVRGRLILRTL